MRNTVEELQVVGFVEMRSTQILLQRSVSHLQNLLTFQIQRNPVAIVVENTLPKMTRVRNYNYSENGLRLYLPKFMYYFFESKLSRS